MNSVRPREVWQSVPRAMRRLIIIVIGGTVLLTGLALLVLPGPGWVVIFGGLAILAVEFAWAARLLHQLKQKARDGCNYVLGKESAEPASDAAPPIRSSSR